MNFPSCNQNFFLYTLMRAHWRKLLAALIGTLTISAPSYALDQSSIHLDFGTSRSAVAPGYLRASVVAYSASRGFGWQSTSGVSAQDRRTKDPLTRDLHLGTQSNFIVSLRPGTYDVTLTLGDARYARNNVNVWAQGVPVALGIATAAGVFVTKTFQTATSDGNITIGISSTSKFAIDGMDIQAAGLQPPPIPTPTANPTSTPQPTPTQAPTPIPTPTPTVTPTSTAAPSATPTATPQSTATPAPSAIPTAVPTTAPTATPTSTTQPSPTPSPTATLITDAYQIFSEPYVLRPSYMVPLTDPVFKTKITRIAGVPGASLNTSNLAAGKWSSDARHNYSTNQPVNSAGTLYVMENKSDGGGSPSLLFLRLDTYEVVYGPPRNLDSGADLRWHPSLQHAYEMIQVTRSSNQVKWIDIANDIVTRTFTLPFTPDYLGETDGNLSSDGRYAGFIDTSGTKLLVLDMDPPAGGSRVGPVFDLQAEHAESTAPTHMSISPSGKYVYVAYYDGNYKLRVFNVDASTLALSPRVLPESSARCNGSGALGYIYSVGHSDSGINPFDNNEDVIVGQEECGYKGKNITGVKVVNSNGIGHVVMIRLKDGAVTSLTDPKNEAYAHHVSLRNTQDPQWVVVSYGAWAGQETMRFFDEVVEVSLDGKQRVRRIAHTHSDFDQFTGNSCPSSDSDFNYRSESHVVPSPGGDRFFMASNWLIKGNGGCTIEDYVIDIRP